MKSIVVAVLAACLSGCISNVPQVPVTPVNQKQVDGCQTIATTHNDLVVGGFVLSAGATGLGGVAAIDTNPNDRTAYGIAAAILGALTAADTAWAALTASQFVNGTCPAVVGPLGAREP